MSRLRVRATVVAGAALLLGLVFGASAAHAAPPVNDAVASATVINATALPYHDSLDNTEATADAGLAPTPCGDVQNSVWYRINSPTPLTVSLDMAGSSFGDTFINVYAGFDPSNLLWVNCRRFGGSLQVRLQPFQTYFVAAGDVNGGGGQLQIDVSRVAAPANDDFANAAKVTAAPFSDGVDPIAATTELFEPRASCGFSSASGGTVWYAFTPQVDGTVVASLDSALQAPGLIAAYTGPTLSTLGQVGCATFFGFGVPLNFHATAGTTYYFQAADLSSDARALQFGLSFTPDGPPAVPGDNIADPVDIGSLPFAAVVDDTQATNEPAELFGCGPINHTVWYRLSVTTAAVLNIDSSGSGFAGSAIGIYKAENGGFGIAGCAFDPTPVFLTVRPGETYYLQAGSFGGAGTGLLHVNVNIVTPPPNDGFSNAAQITSTPFSAPLDLKGATTESREPSPSCAFPPRGSAWYVFAPASSATYTGGLTSENGFGFLVEYGVYTGTSLDSLSQVQCNLGNPLQFDAVAGRTYYIQVANGGGLAGPATFSLRALDSTPPVITPVLTGTLGDGGWYRSDVGVAWTIADPESVIGSTVGCDLANVTTDTTGKTFTCTATSAGGTSTQSVTVKRDATPPAVTCSATPATLWPPNHLLVPVTVAAGVTDTTSGPAGFTLVGTATTEGAPAADIVGWTVGTDDTSGQLRADRTATVGDRVYSLTYRGRDTAGNTADCTVQVVVPHDQGQ